MTQENMRAPGFDDRQEKVTICDRSFYADPEMIPLLRALNESGLQTRSHCSGHGKEPAWVAISMQNIVGVEIRKHGEYKELIISWDDSFQKS